jgi:nicotinamide-nucleotide adenylyltransferase
MRPEGGRFHPVEVLSSDPRSRKLPVMERTGGAEDRRPRLEPIGGEPTGTRATALLAGSFDPPTIGHLELASAWRAGSGGDVVLLYADRTLPKELGTEPPMLDDEGRLEALRRLTVTHEGLFAARASHRLLVDQAEAARDRWPRAPLTILLGSDKVLQLFEPAWYEDRDAALDRLFAAANVRYAARVGHRGLVPAIIARPENARFRGHIEPIEVPGDIEGVSSSEVRRRIRAGDSVADLVPIEILSLFGT